MNPSLGIYAGIRIETPENIAFEYELAGPGTRMIAYLIDFSIIIVILMAFNGCLFLLEFEVSAINDILLAIGVAFSSLLFPLGGYFMVAELVMNGQSPGKKALGIRVLQEDGTPCTFLSILNRNIFRIADCFFPFQYAVGGLLLIFSARVQRVGDLMAGTIVVIEFKPEKASKYVWKPRKIQFQGSTELIIPQEEFDMILEYISVYRNLEVSVRARLSEKLVRPLIERNELEFHPDFALLVQKLRLSAIKNRYQSAERIMKKVLERFDQ